MTTELMGRVIAFLQILEPTVQDQVARAILEGTLGASFSETVGREICSRLAEAAADFETGRYTEDGDAFWMARLVHAKGMKVIR